MSERKSLFEDVAEGTVELMQSDRGDCLCCPPGGHVFCYSFGFDGRPMEPGVRGPVRPHADDIVRDLLRKALLELGSAEAVNRLHLRLKVELVDA